MSAISWPYGGGIWRSWMDRPLSVAGRITVEAEGRIDLVVNNAGFGISGAIEFTTTEEAQRLFDANFFGMVRMNRCVVPIMRRQGGGRIINLSSVAAPVARQVFEYLRDNLPS